MNKILLVYVPCENKEQAESIGKALLKKKLCSCVNVIEEVGSFYIWHSKLEEAREALLLIKTLKEKYDILEREIKSLHTYEIPAILSFEVNCPLAYFQWMKGEIAT